MNQTSAPDLDKNIIKRNISAALHAATDEISGFRVMPRGLSNISLVFEVRGRKYVYRHPGNGNGQFVNRKNEKKSLAAAKRLGLDPTFIYMDDSGWKISYYVTSYREPDYGNKNDCRKAAAVLRRLHSSKIKADYGIRPWDDACAMENIIKEKAPELLSGVGALKEKILRLCRKTENDGIKKCFCHGDTYAPNWMFLPDGRVILIDWEYAGASDPGIDVGYYITDAMYDFDEADAFIRMYLGDNVSEKNIIHFMNYVPITAYYWYIWALYRKSGGDDTGEYENKWHFMAEKYASRFV